MEGEALEFQTRLTHFRPPAEAAGLPFAIGSAAQYHPAATKDSHSPQDAAAIVIGRNCLVGVVADGCTGTHPQLTQGQQGQSSNEVGAKLLAHYVAQWATRLALAHPRSSDDALLKKLNDRTLKVLRAMLRTFCGTDSFARELFTRDFFMTTVLGFVVTDSRYLVFHSGDGVIAVNGEVVVLDGHEGNYLAGALLSDNGQTPDLTSHCLKRHSSGSTRDLNSIFVATDGLRHLAIAHADALRDFIRGQPTAAQVRDGYDRLWREFRVKIVRNPQTVLSLDDDATFVMLRRIEQERS